MLGKKIGKLRTVHMTPPAWGKEKGRSDSCI